MKTQPIQIHPPDQNLIRTLEKLEGEILESCGLQATFLQELGKRTIPVGPPAGFCQCGCGQRTKIAKGTDKRKGNYILNSRNLRKA